ncbi:Crp/Fnr family transcriptional regulator [Amaricoccus macauensis]|uniref:Crp/Fnr family transcriptional regulator n=1 Tax=Amaricoccus macauensis TaxID=57001 RepID=UPI003C79C15E
MPTESKLTRRLRHGARLSERDIGQLETISASAIDIVASTDLIKQHDVAKHAHIILDGVACRYKFLRDGRRAIVALLLPGDFCDLQDSIQQKMDHSIATLVDCRIAKLDKQEITRLLESSPAIRRACLWATMVEEATLREWLVNVGRRSSEEAVAHLFCELDARLGAVGLARGHVFYLPLTQATIADVIGISAVHVQRVIANLKDAGLIMLQDRVLVIPDFASLAEMADFDETYLHLGNTVGPHEQ